MDINKNIPNGEKQGKESMPEVSESKPQLGFGWCNIRPKCLQFLNGPRWFLFAIVVYTVLQATIVMGLTSVTIPMVERRYALSGKQIGLIAAANDISAIVVVLFISYYGDYGNKIRWIGGGGIVLGIGSILYAVPHFLSGDYEPARFGPKGPTCSPPPVLNISGPPILPKCVYDDDTEWYYMALLFIGQLVIGAGVSPFYSLAPPYLDENVHPKSLPIYLGISVIATFLSPAVGLVIGGKFVSIYVDIDQPAGLNLPIMDPRWIGAWWLGFITFGLLVILWSLVILGFPKELPGASKRRLEHIAKGHLRKPNKVQKPSLKTILPDLKNLLTNWTFVFNVIGAICTSLYLGAMVPFLPKIIISKFELKPDQLGYAVAGMTAPFILVGTAIGLLLVKSFSLKTVCKKSALVVFIFRGIGSIGAFVFMIPGCKNLNLVGLTSSNPYNATVFTPPVVLPVSNATSPPSLPVLKTSCNIKCGCPLARLAPVCGSDKRTYFDVCHAGCASILPNKTFGNCSCVPSQKPGTPFGTVKEGFCDRDCKNFLFFAGMFALVELVQFINVVPEKTVILRCVPDNKRAFASGVQYMLTKTLGLLPGPIIFGDIFDSACELWQNLCGKKGRCFIYDIDKVSLAISVLGIAILGFSIIFYFFSWYLYHPEEENEKSPEIGLENKVDVAPDPPRGSVM